MWSSKRNYPRYESKLFAYGSFNSIQMIDQNFKLNEQNSLLRRLTGNAIADLNDLNNDLERYKQMLEMFDEIIKEQVSMFKDPEKFSHLRWMQ